MDITDLLVQTKRLNASDLHLTAGARPTLRINGKLTRLDMPELGREEIHALIYDILTDEQKAKFEATHDLDFSLELNGVGRFRINAFLHRLGEGAVLRLIPEGIKSLAELGMPPVLKDLAMQDRGLVLITGPTGSGKSTTLAAMIDHMNENREDHIITVEDPIEFVHTHKKCNINQREVGPHTMSFAVALRSALREDPDVILVGEMRDTETIEIALKAAETGHLVLSTVHTTDAARTIGRLCDAFPADAQEPLRHRLAENLKGTISQRLLPKAQGKGRVVAAEVMVSTDAIREYIVDPERTHEITDYLSKNRDVYGTQSFDQHLSELYRAGTITLDVAKSAASNPSDFERALSFE